MQRLLHNLNTYTPKSACHARTTFRMRVREARTEYFSLTGDSLQLRHRASRSPGAATAAEAPTDFTRESLEIE